MCDIIAFASVCPAHKLVNEIFVDKDNKTIAVSCELCAGFYYADLLSFYDDDNKVIYKAKDGFVSTYIFEGKEWGVVSRETNLAGSWKIITNFYYKKGGSFIHVVKKNHGEHDTKKDVSDLDDFIGSVIDQKKKEKEKEEEIDFIDSE